ncbi:hypothetical protein FRC09_016947 [Ceratobasidium sp. 395]|nr:hypothetical protein FRC09_016947 [Ceratobasidium sp. 395]
MSSWLASSRNPENSPAGHHRIIFPSILKNPWYKEKRNLKAKTIQYRKEFRPPFRHEYLVISLSDGSICRFDRRPDPSVPLDALREGGSEAYDTVEEMTPAMLASPNIQTTSECLATLTFQDELDLFFIFLVCYGIQSDRQAVRYTLLQYNCYFFSWTIILNIARNSVTWEGLSTYASFKTLPKNIASELSTMLVHGVLAQSTTVCSGVIRKALAQLAVLLPSRLSAQLPHLRKPLQQLPHLLCHAPHSRHPTSIIRWKLLKIKMLYSLEYALTNEIFRRKLLRRIRKAIPSFGQLGNDLCATLNDVLRRTLWRDNLNEVIQVTTINFLRKRDADEYLGGSDSDSDESGSDTGAVLLASSSMWDEAGEVICREVVLTFQENVLDMFAKLVYGIISGGGNHQKSPSDPDTKPTLDGLYEVVRDTLDASLSDILKESLLGVVWETARREQEVDDAIARAIGSVTASLLHDSPLPFALKDPILLKSEIRWHIARWAKKTTTGVDVQVSHSMLEQYFGYRIAAHSRAVRRFNVVQGYGVDTKKVLYDTIHRVWEIVSGASGADQERI